MPKAMIITVGGTPPPIIKSICEYRPEFVSFFASQDTNDLIKTIKDETLKNGVVIKSELTLADDVNDFFHCHSKADEAVIRVLNKGYNKDDVIVGLYRRYKKTCLYPLRLPLLLMVSVSHMSVEKNGQKTGSES